MTRGRRIVGHAVKCFKIGRQCPFKNGKVCPLATSEAGARRQLEQYYSPTQRQETLDLPYLTLLCDNLKKQNVPPKLFFLTLFWEFVILFQLSTSFQYSTAKQFH
jgi:hypothetical protein